VLGNRRVDMSDSYYRGAKQDCRRDKGARRVVLVFRGWFRMAMKGRVEGRLTLWYGLWSCKCEWVEGAAERKWEEHLFPP
jgi:hypothetical protein